MTSTAKQAPGAAPPAALRSRPALTLAASALLLFLLITWQVVTHGPLTRADRHLSADVTAPDRVSGLLADLGSIAVAVPVLALALGCAARRAHRAGAPGWWLPSLAAAALMAVLPGVVLPLKDLIARPGPPVMGATTGFFPSGHTATATIAYGAAALVLWPWLTTPRARRALLTAAASLNLAVAYGLIRHGYHWPLDVLGSWCLCGALLCGLRVLLGTVTAMSAGTLTAVDDGAEAAPPPAR
ncbi:phosphatase PAP2 family protein [Streptomyces sp. NPDC052040]|uniref:phosphatase PAP2 family protein n=1 Tax=unclassified Streptomyces TaxID=2593676 RepID=UPI0037D0B331